MAPLRFAGTLRLAKRTPSRKSLDLIFAAAVCVQPDVVGLKFLLSLKRIKFLRRTYQSSFEKAFCETKQDCCGLEIVETRVSKEK